MFNGKHNLLWNTDFLTLNIYFSGFQVSQVDLRGVDRVALEQTILTYMMMETMICTVRTIIACVQFYFFGNIT